MRITCHYGGIYLVSRGTYVPPTTPSLLFWFVVLVREFLQRKKTIILCFTQYDCRNGCTARAELIT